MTVARIVSTGRSVPPVVVTNAEMNQRLGKNVSEWLTQNVGIEQRCFMRDDQVPSDLATEASAQALARAGVDPKDVDLVIVATDTPDTPSPATASVVQHKLRATRAGTFDVNCACAGWVTALDMGAKYIAADPSYRNVLVTGVYGMSRHLDWSDKTTCTLFADGAGAVLLQASAAPGHLSGQLYADGSYHDALGIYAKGVVQFTRRFPPTYNVEHWPRMLHAAADKARVRVADIGLFVFTQLNLRTIEEVMAKLQLPLERAHWVMHKWGYTGSACIPMTLDDAVEHGKVKPGDLVAFCGSGGGVSMASAIFRW
ncbi:MAG: ketoacyl-ACP synthase III [Myxococcaceae bacterium]|nr:ketoacyl-ACP synthase III [Myxococcaceae bacterium]